MRDTFKGQMARVISTSTLIKARPGRVSKLHVSGVAPTFLQVLDGNIIGSGVGIFQAPSSIAGGTTFDLDVPCNAGIVVMMGAGGVTVVYS